MNTLSTSQAVTKELQQQEQIIERGLKGYVEAGIALETIKSKKLYKDQYGTYEEYCRQRWDFSPQYANKLISAKKTVTIIAESETMVSVLPKSERQVRALGKADDPTATWLKAQEEAGKDQPSAQEIAEVISQSCDTVINAVAVEIEPAEPVTCDPLQDTLSAILLSPYEMGHKTGRPQIAVNVDDESTMRLKRLKKALPANKGEIVAQALVLMEMLLELEADRKKCR